MSTLLGIFAKENKVESKDINLMLNHSTTTFYDQRRIWIKDNVGLGQLHRYTTNEDVYMVMPYTTPDNKLTIVADARIDNREELADKLNISNIELSKLSDSHIIVTAFQKWSYNCPKYLLGDFTFAIYEQQKKSIFIAKDPIGIKRLYYFQSNACFAFASSINSLMALPYVSLEFNELEIYKYLLHLNSKNGEETFFKKIRRLRGGHTLLINSSKTVIEKYWFYSDLPKINLKNHHEYLEQAKYLFSKSVNNRLRTNKNGVGFELSGGLDTSAIICHAAANSYKTKSLQTFSNMNNHSDDIYIRQERSHLQEVLNSYQNIIPSFIDEEKQRAYQSIDNSRYFEKINYLFNHVQVIGGQPLYKEVRESGLNVLLSGQGGDECVSYRKMGDIYELVEKKMWKELYILLQNPPIHKGKRKQFHQILKVILQKYLPPPIKRIAKQYASNLNLSKHRKGEYYKILHSKYLCSDFVKRNEKAYLEEKKNNFIEDSPLYDVQQFAERQLFDAFQNIADTGGVTYRFPMVDVPLIQFFGQIPVEFRVKNGLQCYLFREMILDDVPKRVALRNDKMGNIYPTMKQYTQENLSNMDIIIEQYFSQRCNHDIFDQQEVNNANNKFELPYFLFNFMSYDMFLIQYK